MSKIRPSTQIAIEGGSPGDVLTIDVGGAWVPAAPAPGGRSIAGGIAGTLAVAAGTTRLYNDSGRTLTLTKVRASVGTAPTGAAILVDVNKNGTTIFTTSAHRPSIAAGTQTAVASGIDVTSWADGDYLTVDVDQIGSTVAGSDLTVQIEVTG